MQSCYLKESDVLQAGTHQDTSQKKRVLTKAVTGFQTYQVSQVCSGYSKWRTKYCSQINSLFETRTALYIAPFYSDIGYTINCLIILFLSVTLC